MSANKTILEPEKRIPVVCEVDLVVVGGSCTGVFAAVRAARLGLKVAIIERHNCFGGVATVACVNVWHSLFSTDGETPIIGGLTCEVLDRLKRRDAVLCSDNPVSAFRLNTEELKVTLDELVLEHKISPFLHTFYVAPVMDGDRLDAVVVENKNGRQAIRGRCFIDATGDGDLARDLNVPSYLPDTLQPPTTCAKVMGWDQMDGFDWQAAIRDHGHEFGLRKDWGWGGPIPGLANVSMRADTHVFDCDTSDAEQLSRAEIEGRRQVRAIMDLIHRYAPESVRLTLVDLSASIGARETRRIFAKYQLQGDDVLYGRRFEDAIANGSYRVDIHHADGPGITFRYLNGEEVVVPERGMKGIRGRWREPMGEDPTFYQIPFRSLLQERVTNLLLAGRMLDADKVAFSAVRVMVNMNQTGEAAGVAAALYLRGEGRVQDLNPVDVREELVTGGSIII